MNADYIKQGLVLTFCPKASVPAFIGKTDVSITIAGYSNPTGGSIQVDRAAMINGEIVSIKAVAGNVLSIGRGCCDTVPQEHSAGSRIWFIDEAIGSTLTPYGLAQTVSVKGLPKAYTGELPIAYSVPKEVTFNSRFQRPYPPGNVIANGQPFATDVVLDGTALSLALSWAHRNRVSQGDSLVDHLAASVIPEAGTTYRIRLYKADNTPVLTVIGIETASHSFSIFEIAAAFNNYVGVVSGYLLLDSLRDGLASWQAYRIDFTYEGIAEPPLSDRSIAYLIGIAASPTQDLGISYSVASGTSTSAFNPSDKDADVTLTNSSRTAEVATGTAGSVRGTQARNASDNRFFDVEITGAVGANTIVGIGKSSASLFVFPGALSNGYGYEGASGALWSQGSDDSYGATFATGDRIRVHLNAGTLIFKKWNGSAFVNQGTAITGLTGDFYPMVGFTTSAGVFDFATINTGQVAFDDPPGGGAVGWG